MTKLLLLFLCSVNAQPKELTIVYSIGGSLGGGKEYDHVVIVKDAREITALIGTLKVVKIDPDRFPLTAPGVAFRFSGGQAAYFERNRNAFFGEFGMIWVNQQFLDELARIIERHHGGKVNLENPTLTDP